MNDGTEVKSAQAEKLEGLLAQSADELIKLYGSKSSAIRGLADLGAKCGPISRALGIKFQHARNVLNKPLKREIAAARKAAAEADAK